MLSKLLSDEGGLKTYSIVLETGDEVMTCLQDFATRQRLSAAQFSGIGAFEEVDLMYFDWQEKKFISNPVREQVEVASLTGDVALAPDGKPALHIHLVVGRRDGTALAGHLGRGQVRPTLEIMLTETPAHLRKTYDPETGLTLIRPNA
jgi:uncharacterized protein